MEHILIEGGEIIISPLCALEELERELPQSELQQVEQFASAARKRERLSWRLALHHYFERIGQPTPEVQYSPCGAPYLVGSQLHIGVSHCKNSIALIISNKPVAIDIEPLDRNFSRAIERVASPEELALSHDEHLPALLWCAKETLYKLAGKNGLDMRHDLRICAIDVEQGDITAQICDEQVSLHMFEMAGNMVVWGARKV